MSTTLTEQQVEDLARHAYAAHMSPSPDSYDIAAAAYDTLTEMKKWRWAKTVRAVLARHTTMTGGILTIACDGSCGHGTAHDHPVGATNE